MDVGQRCGEPGGRPEDAQRHEGRMRREVEGARASRVPFNGRRRVPEGQVVEGVKGPEGETVLMVEHHTQTRASVS